MRNVSTVKKCYGVIVSALEGFYLESHEPKALGISKILSKPTTLYYILPQVSKLSKTLQKDNLDLSIISGLLDATVHTLEDVLLPAANWVLDVKEEMGTTVGINFNSEDIASFQKRVTSHQIERKHPKPLHFTGCCLLFQHSFLIPRRFQILQKTVHMENVKLKYSMWFTHFLCACSNLVCVF